MLTTTIRSCAAALLLAACSSPPAPTPPPPPPPAPEIAHFDSFAYRGEDSVYAKLEASADQYFNPILPGFYPDPSIVRVGEDYYLVNSTFAFFPGLPLFHSRDLVHWQQIGNAIDRPGQVDFGKLGISRGLFAPAIDHHDGTFAILNTCVDCGGNFLITATNPAGPWSDPIWLGFEGIDPSLFFDSDGKAYIVNNGLPEGGPLYDGHRAIWMQEFDWAAKKLVGPRRMLVNGGTDIRKKPVWIEGPHLFRIGRWYYLMCAEGGTGDRHSEVIFRSRKAWGPYRSYKANPILTQRDLDPARPDPVTSTGHAQLVYAGWPSRSSAPPARHRHKGRSEPSTRPANEGWWAVFLATRPYADDIYNTGRETFLLPVSWKNGWPVILKKGKPVPYMARRPALPAQSGPAEAGDFERTETFAAAGTLDPHWLMIRTPHESWYAISKDGLAITARAEAIGGDGQPSFIGRRQQHGWMEASAGMRFDAHTDGARAGLVAFQNSDYFYFLDLVREQGTESVCVTKRAGVSDPEQGAVVACAPVTLGPDANIDLKIVARGAAYDFAYATAPGQWTTLVRDADGTILSTKKAGGFVGTIIGMYAFTPQK